MEVVREVSGSVSVVKKPGAGKIRIQSLRVFLRAYVHFKSEPSKVVGKEGNPFFKVSPGFKNECVVVYIDHA